MDKLLTNLSLGEPILLKQKLGDTLRVRLDEILLFQIRQAFLSVQVELLHTEKQLLGLLALLVPAGRPSGVDGVVELRVGHHQMAWVLYFS